MNINDIISDADQAPLSTQLFYQLAFDVVDRVHEILEQKGMTQKDLAKVLGKSPSEVSKWLTGQHNLTLKSICAMEAALGEPIVVTEGGNREMAGPIPAFQRRNLRSDEISKLIKFEGSRPRKVRLLEDTGDNTFFKKRSILIA